MTDTLKEQFGQRLAFLRKQSDLTQSELAEKVGVSEETISNIERGLYGPRFALLSSLSVALRVPVKSLFDF
jgi:transcriptional regulator with XRE-family HTH domain